MASAPILVVPQKVRLPRVDHRQRGLAGVTCPSATVKGPPGKTVMPREAILLETVLRDVMAIDRLGLHAMATVVMRLDGMVIGRPGPHVMASDVTCRDAMVTSPRGRSAMLHEATATGAMLQGVTARGPRGRSVMAIGPLAPRVMVSVVMRLDATAIGRLGPRAMEISLRGRSAMLRAVMVIVVMLRAVTAIGVRGRIVMEADRLGLRVMVIVVMRLGVMVTDRLGPRAMATSLRGRSVTASPAERAGAVMNHACGLEREARPVVTPLHPLGSYPRIGTRTARSLFGSTMMLQRFPKKFSRISSIVSHVHN